MSESAQPARIRLVLLTLGATAGLILAASGLVENWSSSSASIPATAIARVGGRDIPQERYLELLSDLAADKRTPLNSNDRKFALDRLIDEELLIMRGIELGLHETSPEIRKTIAAAVIAQIAAEAEATTPDEATLRRFYETESPYFTTTARYQLRWWRVPGSGPESERKAATAYGQLSKSVPAEAVMRSTGLQAESLLPDQMLPLSKLTDYLGPRLAQRATVLEPGEFSRPIAAGGGFHIIHLLSRQEGVLPAFEQVRPVVEAEYSRRSGDDALRQYLAWLRGRTEIIVDSDKYQ